MKSKFITADFGFRVGEIAPFVSFVEGEAHPVYNESETASSLAWHATGAGFTDDIYFKKDGRGVIARRVFKNTSTDVLKLRELGFRISGIMLASDPKRDYYYHTENPRLFNRLVLFVDQKRRQTPVSESEYDEVAGNKWADPGVIVDRIGTCPYQPFPAILLSNLDTGHGLVHGTLSQNVFYHCYLPYHTDGALSIDIYSAFKDIDYRNVAPGENLVDEWYLGDTERAEDLELIFREYSDILRRYLPANYGATQINRDNLVWGTWNDGISRSVNEKLVLDTLPYLTKYFPSVRWLQLDDGYCAHQSAVGFKAHGLGVPYEGEDGVDKQKFPNGLRYLSDKIRESGLRPAIWIGGFCPKDTKISLERRDLMCDYKFRSGRCDILDVSNPEARDYMTDALDTMLYDWGFEGVKHDFWSYAFEVSEPLLGSNDRSGYEYRRWWLSEIRKRIPGDAYLQTGCDIVMANPFLGEFFTNYRYGIDVGAGSWQNFKTNYLWCIACLATHTGDIFVPNSDAVGMFPGLSDTDAEFCTNFILITRTMVELAGKFSEVDVTSPRFAMLRKATANVNNGEDVYFADYDYRTANNEPPAILYIKSPYFASEKSNLAPLRTVALFNLSDEKNTTLNLTRVGLDLAEGDYILTDVWSGERLYLHDSLSFDLPPHNSRLFTVSKTDAPVLDSSVKLGQFRLEGESLAMHLYYGSDCSVTFAKSPEMICFNGSPIDFTTEDGVTRFDVPAAGELKVYF